MRIFRRCLFFFLDIKWWFYSCIDFAIFFRHNSTLFHVSFALVFISFCHSRGDELYEWMYIYFCLWGKREWISIKRCSINPLSDPSKGLKWIFYFKNCSKCFSEFSFPLFIRIFFFYFHWAFLTHNSYFSKTKTILGITLTLQYWQNTRRQWKCFFRFFSKWNARGKSSSTSSTIHFSTAIYNFMFY